MRCLTFLDFTSPVALLLLFSTYGWWYIQVVVIGVFLLVRNHLLTHDLGLAVVLPSTVFMKFVHSFLLAKRECQASAD
jgi:hypothetical protein